MDQNTLAYLAGFFDGEGSIIHRIDLRSDYEYYSVAIGQTEKAPLFKFVDAFGSHIQRYKQVTKGGLLYYRYVTNKRDRVRSILRDLYPYLIVKKQKASQALGFLHEPVPQEREWLIEPYTAGFFDAEGSISIRHHHRNKITSRIRITQTVVDPLLFIQERFGGSVRLVNAKTKKGSDIYHWILGQGSISNFYDGIKPYLCVKQAQMELLVRMLSIKLATDGYDTRAPEKIALAQQIIHGNSGKSNKDESRVLQLVEAG